jgi:ubiquinone/menaquinone biosynthesis C-methylase UbiE
MQSRVHFIAIWERHRNVEGALACPLVVVDEEFLAATVDCGLAPLPESSDWIEIGVRNRKPDVQILSGALRILEDCHSVCLDRGQKPDPRAGVGSRMRRSKFTNKVDLEPEIREQELDAARRKDREHHRQVAPAYDRAITDIYAIYHRWDLHPWIAQAARRHPNGHAIDIGAGTGAVSGALVAAGFRVSAVDHSPEMLDVARQRIGRPDFLSTYVADALTLPFDDDVADVVTMQGILHHVPIAYEGVLAEAHRVLKPGGSLYISEPCSDTSLLSRILRNPRWFRVYDPEGEETDEELIGWARLSRALNKPGFDYDVKFVTHIPSAHFHYWLPDRLRLGITVLASFPFRRGDLLFVHGRKPLPGPVRMS